MVSTIDALSKVAVITVVFTGKMTEFLSPLHRRACLELWELSFFIL